MLSEYDFKTALDAFSGSGSVSYLLKTMGKSVTTNDFLHFCATIAQATVENDEFRIGQQMLDNLLKYDPRHKRFIEQTFKDIFYTPADLRFLDRVLWNIRHLENPHHRALAKAALIRSCMKRQPRGVFTVAGDPEKYKDNRRDLKLSLEEHFIEQISIYNQSVFSNGGQHRSYNQDIYELKSGPVDLVYMDPPYVPRSDDNCYIKRYHFLEGLSCYWNNVEILTESRVKKIAKRYTPFSYRRTAEAAFDGIFRKFSDSILVLSYSSNGYPDLDMLVSLMRRFKDSVKVYTKEHRYHFGTHANANRNQVDEYLIVGA